jgi:hypothetical protein
MILPSLLIQAIALVAVAVFAASFQFKTRKQILFWQLVSMLFWALHFLLLGASTALSLILVNAIITLLLFFKDDHLWMNRYSVLVFLLLILATLTGLTWEGFFSSFAFLGVALITVAKWQNKTKNIKFIALFASASWIVYDFFVGSSGGIIAELVIIFSILIGLMRDSEKRIT